MLRRRQTEKVRGEQLGIPREIQRLHPAEITDSARNVVLAVVGEGAVAGVVGNEGGAISSLDQQAIPAFQGRFRSHDED